MSLCTCMTEAMWAHDAEPVAVWTDYENNLLMSDLGSVDTTCFARICGGHCPGRDQCVMLDRAPGPRLLLGSELMSEIDDEKGIYLDTHAKRVGADVISITVDHVGPEGCPGNWRYRLLPMRWRNHGHDVSTNTRLAVWPD